MIVSFNFVVKMIITGACGQLMDRFKYCQDNLSDFDICVTIKT